MASEVMLIGTGDWTEVYLDGVDFLGGHSLSDYDWAQIIKQAQAGVESISRREFIQKADDDYWPYNNDWPNALRDIPESELQAVEVLMAPRSLNLPEGPA